MKSAFKLTALLLLAVLLSGCDLPVQQMETTEYGIKFRKLPPALGGGVSSKVISPGEMVFLWPWDSVYRFDTAVRYLSWGDKGKGTNKKAADYVYTRALDGNEVALAVTIQYQISDKPEDLLNLVQVVANSNKKVDELVKAVARADIRTYMNELKTAAFFNRDSRYSAIDKAMVEMNKRLNPIGIVIKEVILDEHRFERQLPDGTIDRSYQQKIDDTQKTGQDTQRELLRIETVRAKKTQLLNDTQAKVNRMVAEAEGYKKQAVFRGDAYLAAKRNQAKAISARGKAAAEGLAEQIKALSGRGGKAMVKLALVKELLKKNPKFVIVGGADTGSGLDVRKIDTNELLSQIGIVEGLGQKSPKKLKRQAVPGSDDSE